MKQKPRVKRDHKQNGLEHRSDAGPGKAKGHHESNAKHDHTKPIGRAKAGKKHVDLPALLTDKSLLRKMARKEVEDGAITPDYKLDKDLVIGLLNESLATELVCTLRYKRHYYVANRIKGRYVAAEFAQHAIEELAHADLIAERIMQLGGTPDFNPVGLAERSHAEYFEGTDLQDMIRENLIAERIAIESYRAFAQFLGEADPTTRRMIESILAMEEEHANELTDLMED